MCFCIRGSIPAIASLLFMQQHFVFVNGWRPFAVHVDELSAESFSSKCRVNSSVTYPGLLNINVDILETVKASFSHTELFLQSSNSKYDLQLINRTIDMCRLYKDLSYEPILQVGLKLYKSSGNEQFFTSCIMKKGIYSLKDLKLNVEHLPPVFPEKNGYYRQTYYLDNTHRLFSVKLYFSVNKVFKKNN